MALICKWLKTIIYMNKTLLTLFLLCSVSISVAQTGKTQVVRLNATANANGSITLNWPQENWTGTWGVFKKTVNSTSWGSAIASLAGAVTTYTDNTVKTGESYEYLVTKTSGTTNTALGYIYAGNKYREQPSMGGICLLVDSAYRITLSNEINRLKDQLYREGWQPFMLYAGRKEKVETVRDRIIAAYDQRKGNIKSLLIIGRVPVPYSGDFLVQSGSIPAPDGHPDHGGAWPADGYYGDMDGLWSDLTVNNKVGSQTRNHNIPKDGKLDQTKFPNELELEVGRVDLFNMPAFSNNDTLLVRKYLNRNWLWRNDRLKTADRALIDDNFTNLNLSSTGYQNLTAMFPFDSVFENRDYFTAQKSGPYLWSYGCGAGSNTSCSGIGTTSSFVADSLQNIFTMLAGSYFGDWDQQNNLLRAPLCNSALACSWGGIPKWYVHHMALGMNIGYGAKLSMNNIDQYWNGGFNFSHNSVHMALMGDPTLKLKNVASVSGAKANSQAGYVKLNWNKAQGVIDGYAVYRFDSVENTYYRVNKNHIIKDTFYTDSTNYFNGKNIYSVRAIRLERTASGTWYNLGAGSFTSVMHTNNSRSVTRLEIKVYPNPADQTATIAFPGALPNNCVVGITDAAGREVASYSVKAGEWSSALNISGLAHGVYCIRLQGLNGNILASQTLIKTSLH